MPPENQPSQLAIVDKLSSPVDVSIAEKQAKRSELEKIVQQATVGANSQNREGSLSDAFKSALVAALPALVGGLASGKRGVGTGLIGGGKAAAGVEKQRLNKFDEAKRLLLAQAEIARGNIGTLDKDIGALEKEKRGIGQTFEKEKFKGQFKKGTTINNFPGGTDKPRQRKLVEEMEGKAAVLATLNNLDIEASELIQESGGLNLKATFSPNDKAGQFFRRLKANALLIGKKTLKDRLSDEEGRRFVELLGGDESLISGNVIKISTIRELMAAMKDETEKQIRLVGKNSATSLEEILDNPEAYAEDLISRGNAGEISPIKEQPTATTKFDGMTLEEKKAELARLKKEAK